MPRGKSKSHEYNVRANGLGGYFSNGGGGGGKAKEKPKAHWSEIDPSYVTALVLNAELVGIAVLFGKSRDEYSLSIGVFMGGDKNVFYFPADEGYAREVEQWIAKFCEDCQDTAKKLSEA